MFSNLKKTEKQEIVSVFILYFVFLLIGSTVFNDYGISVDEWELRIHGFSNLKYVYIRVEGISGSNSVKVFLDGEGEMQKIEISEQIIKEDKQIIEDLIVAAHNDAKAKLKLKTNEEISKATGNFGIPGFKWPL